MMRIFRNYFFWTYERGSFHYDVMVTLILLFLFVAPHFIDFGDKPVPTLPIRSSEVLVRSSGVVREAQRFTYEIRKDDLGNATTDTDLRAAILRVVEPIAGEVTLLQYKPVTDGKGHILAYDALVER